MEIPSVLMTAIKEKNCSLFLGAGASMGATSRNNENIPRGQDLSNLIAQEFLSEKFVGKSLVSNADLAISETGLHKVQQFIYDYLEQFHPAPFHSHIAEIPWRSIFTLNYDLIIERVYQQVKNPAQKLAVILSDSDDIRQKLESIRHVLFFKLHGCITVKDKPNLPLILTTDQYLTHLNNRNSLFKSLYEMASSGPIIYVGTSLEDQDIRKIILQIDVELNSYKARSYFIKPNPDEIEIRFWAEKKIEVISGTFEEFLKEVSTKLTLNEVSLAIYSKRSEKPIYNLFIINAEIPSNKIDNFFDNDAQFIHKDMNTSPSNPKSFYKGDGQDFSAIIDDLDVKRKLTDELLLNHIIADSPNDLKPHMIVILGHAGSGKSVLMRRLAYESARTFEKLCIWTDGISNDICSALEEIYTRSQKRIFLFIEGALGKEAELKNLYKYAEFNNIPLTLFISERNNLWNDASETLGQFTSEPYEIKYLIEREIDDLIALLEKHGSLGYLTDKSFEEQRKVFIEHHGRQLLVVLHEATLGKLFSDIVFDEYNSIYPEKAKIFYGTVCMLNRFGIKVRAGLISRVHNIPFDSFDKEFFKPLDHIVISKYDQSIRDNTYKARHQHVAQLVFDRVFTNESDCYIEVMRILRCINIEYETDRESFKMLTNAKTISQSIANIDNLHALYKAAIEIDKDNPFIYQQMGILEMNHDCGNLKKAKEYIEYAQSLSPHNHAIKNSSSVLERKLAKSSINQLEKNEHRRKSKEISRVLLVKDKKDAYSYVNFINVCLDELTDALEEENHVIIEDCIKEIEKMIGQANQFMPFSADIYRVEADFFTLIGEIPNAIIALEKAFHKNKANYFVASRLAKYYIKNNDINRASEVLKEAIEHNRENKDLHFLYASMLMGDKNLTNNEIHHHLSQSFMSKDANKIARFWFARSLYLRTDYQEAYNHFSDLSSSTIGEQIKRKPRGEVWDGDILKTYWGSVCQPAYSYTFIKPDSEARNIFAHSNDCIEFDTLKKSTRVKYNLAFSFKGAVAFNVELAVKVGI